MSPQQDKKHPLNPTSSSHLHKATFQTRRVSTLELPLSKEQPQKVRTIIAPLTSTNPTNLSEALFSTPKENPLNEIYDQVKKEIPSLTNALLMIQDGANLSGKNWHNYDKKARGRASSLQNKLNKIWDAIKNTDMTKIMLNLLYKLDDTTIDNLRFDRNEISDVGDLVKETVIQDIITGKFSKQEPIIRENITKLITQITDNISNALEPLNITPDEYPLVILGANKLFNQALTHVHTSCTNNASINCSFFYNLANTIDTCFYTKLLHNLTNNLSSDEQNQIFQKILKYSHSYVRDYQLSASSDDDTFKHTILVIKASFELLQHAIDEVNFIKSVGSLKNALEKRLEILKNLNIASNLEEEKLPLAQILLEVTPGYDSVGLDIDRRRNTGKILFNENKFKEKFIHPEEMEIITQEEVPGCSLVNALRNQISFKTPVNDNDSISPLYRCKRHEYPSENDNKGFQEVRKICNEIFLEGKKFLLYLSQKEYPMIFNGIENENIFSIYFNTNTREFKISASLDYFSRNFPSYTNKLEKDISDNHVCANCYELTLPLEKYQISHPIIEETKSPQEIKNEEERMKEQLLAEISKIYGGSQKFSTLLKKLKKMGVEFNIGGGVGKGSHESLTYKKRSFTIPHDTWSDKKYLFWTDFKRAIDSLDLPLQELKETLQEKKNGVKK